MFFVCFNVCCCSNLLLFIFVKFLRVVFRFVFLFCFFFFFFKQKTAYEMRISDWSSDVCSSDLAPSRSEISRAWCACACRHTRHRQRSAGSSQGLALAVALIVALLYQGRLVQSIPYTRISILAQYTAMRYIVPRSPPDAHAGEPHQMQLPQPLSLRIAPLVFAAVVVSGCGQTPDRTSTHLNSCHQC